MKLTKQETLHFKDQKSDKVYQVDLCEVGTDQYLVNFRYGKRGGNLKEGSKTDSPVSLTKAEGIFTKLVESKTKKGYTSAASTTQSAPKKTPQKKKSSKKLAPFSIDAMQNHLLEQLKWAVENPKERIPQGEKYTYAHIKSGDYKPEGYIKGGKSDWGLVKEEGQKDNSKEGKRYLSRLVWRVGELKLKEAVPFLLKIKPNVEIIDAYALVWALGRCGTPGESAKTIAKLDKMIANEKQTESVRFLAKEAKMLLLEEADKKEYAQEIFEGLNRSYQSAIKKKNAKSITALIDKTLTTKKTAYEEIAALHLLSSGLPFIRRGLMDWIRKAHLTGGGLFKSIRQLFKVAEFKDDVPMYGLLAYRITVAEKAYVKMSGVDRVYVNTPDSSYWRGYRSQAYDYSKEIVKPTSAVGFSSATKSYFQKRIWRYLRRKAELGNVDYVKFAVAFLMNFKEDDRKYIHYFGVDSTELARCFTLNKMLFLNSKRMVMRGSTTKYVESKKNRDHKSHPSQPVAKREEAYPELWDQLPQGALHLLSESDCKEVNDFALKIINVHLDTLIPMIDAPLILRLLGKKHEGTSLLGFELVKKRFNAKTATFEIIKALLYSPLKEARKKGFDWLAKQQEMCFAQEGFVAEALFIPYAEVPKELGKLIKAHSFTSEEKMDVINKAFAKMLSYPEHLNDEQEKGFDNGKVILNTHFKMDMVNADRVALQSLLYHKASEVYMFGASILLLDGVELKELPEALLNKFIDGYDTEQNMAQALMNKMDIDKIPEACFRKMLEKYWDDIRGFAIELLNKMTTVDHFTDKFFYYLIDFNRHRYREEMRTLGADLVSKLSNEEVLKRNEMVKTLLFSPHDNIRQIAMNWLKIDKDFFFKQDKFVLNIMFSKHKGAAAQFSPILEGYKFKKDAAQLIVDKSIQKMIALKRNLSFDQKNSAINATEILSQHFASYLVKLETETIEALLAHKAGEVNLLGAKILMLDGMNTNKLPETLMTNLINGDAPEMRKVGVYLLTQMSNKDLYARKSLVKKLCLSKHAEVRATIHPIVEKLVKGNKKFGQEFTQEIALFLLRKEAYEGLDDDLSTLLENQLKAYLPSIEKRRVLQLIHSQRRAANILGNRLLQKNIKPKDLTMRQIVRLASHEMEPLRAWVKNAYNKDKARIKYELNEAVRILDATWDDSRDFAFEYFRKNLGKKDWTPDIIVSVCDSVNPLVQQFGKELITKFFKDEDGEQYLIQLSQHPTADLQSFATNYLEQFATDNPDHLEQLELYFITVLSGVNKSSVAKERIYAFLRKEGLKSEKTAKIVARILARQAAMMTVRDKAKCMQIMRDLDRIYGDLEISITPDEIPTYPTKREKV